MSRPGGPRAVLAVSPHLDDAVMSVGATLAALARRSVEVTVCTVFAGHSGPDRSPFAAALHAAGGLAEVPVRARRTEDRTALSSLGARPVQLSHLDAIYRRRGDAWSYPSPRELFGDIPPDESLLVADISRELAGMIARIRPDRVMTCAAVGGHIDHRLARLATLRACAAEGQLLTVWEDLPYGLGHNPPTGLELVEPADISCSDVEAKLAAVGCYASQVRTLWPAGDDWRQRFRDHVASRKRRFGVAELLWNVAVDGDLGLPA